jgi:hypothetical protein
VREKAMAELKRAEPIARSDAPKGQNKTAQGNALGRNDIGFSEPSKGETTLGPFT